MSEDRLLAGLDAAQRRAVTNPHRPLAILAPAGSGKTRVLTRRVAWLAAEGVVDARRALCVSFTREAAGELRSRLAALGLRELPAAGTFHGVAYALLRAWWAGRRLPVPRLVADRTAQLARLLPGSNPAERARLELEVGWAKARLVPPAGYARAARAAGRRPPGGAARTAALFARYDDACRRANLVDFDDLLVHCAHAFDVDTGFAAAQRWRFRHLFVDEFQDVNPLQFRLLQAWLGDGDDVCAVGDPNQAIYGWNGADPGYLLRFSDHFPGAVVERLDRNYRSTAPLVAVAASVLGDAVTDARPDEESDGGSDDAEDGTRTTVRDGHRFAGPPVAVAGDGPVPEVVAFVDEAHEVAGTAAWCRGRYHEGLGWGAQAVLVRTNALARQLAERLDAAGVPTRLLLARPSAGRAAALARVAGQARSLAALAADARSGTLDGLEPDDQLLLADLAREYAAVDPTGTPARFAAWLSGPALAARAGRGVTVATFHAAKGLEWRAVLVAGLEEGLVPSAYASSAAALAEERRLLHVALSRATRHLACTWTRSRAWGGRPAEARRPSPLLAAVEDACRAQDRARRATPPPAGWRSLLRPPPRSVHDDLLDVVLAWRQRRALAVGAPPAAVLSDAATESVARSRPGSVAELAALPEVGASRAHRLGPSILAALAEVRPRAL